MYMNHPTSTKLELQIGPLECRDEDKIGDEYRILAQRLSFHIENQPIENSLDKARSVHDGPIECI